jgi:hypothetical protein
MNRGAIQPNGGTATVAATTTTGSTGFLGGLDFQSAIALAVMVSAFMRR